MVLRNGTQLAGWQTDEPLSVPLGVVSTVNSDGSHYLFTLMLSKQKWQLVLDNKAVATFDGAMVGSPSLCDESTGTNRIVTETLSLAEDASHWVCAAIAQGKFQLLLDGAPIESLSGLCPVTAPAVTPAGRLGPFVAITAAEGKGGFVIPYSQEWKYKWGAYTVKNSIVVGEVRQDLHYADVKSFVVSDDGKHYAYAALKGKLSGVSLSRSGFSQNSQGTWHIVTDGKEGQAWADVHGMCFVQGKSRLAAMVRTVQDKTSRTKGGISVLLESTQVASHEWAWGLSPKKQTVVWFSRTGSDIFINRLVNP